LIATFERHKKVFGLFESVNGQYLENVVPTSAL